MRHAKNTPNTKHLIQRGSACCGARWKVALRDAAARRQGDSRCVCSDGGAVGGRFAAPGGLREQRVEQSEISEHSEHSDGLADARSFSRCGRCVAARGLWLPSACPGRSADLCRAATCLVERWGCCRWARALRCALRIASTGFGFHAALFLGFVLHSTLL